MNNMDNTKKLHTSANCGKKTSVSDKYKREVDQELVQKLNYFKGVHFRNVSEKL